VDIAFAGFSFEQEMIRQATPFEFAPGLVLPTCSAEDLFVMNVFAGRGKDWQDAEGIAIRQRLDRKRILRQLQPLCEIKDAPDSMEQARRILEKHPWRE
jgi:hypothetical protein